MKVLIACEFSGIVREAFKSRGHDAWSCDLLPTEISGQHIQKPVQDVLDDGWDLMIAHPPCKYLCRQAVRWINTVAKEVEFKWAGCFFQLLKEAPIPKIAVENPEPHKRAKKEYMGKYTQTIQPYRFGHDYSKKTCLWLKGLPKLKPTNKGIAKAMAEQWG